MTEHLHYCLSNESVHPTEFNIFQYVLANGDVVQQNNVVTSVAFVHCRSVRRALIDVMNDTSVALDTRDGATEMLHLHGCRETAEACAKVLDDRNPSIRFWAAYTLGQITRPNSPFRDISASASEKILHFEAIVPGWWSVEREAQAMIAAVRGDPVEEEQLQAEVQRVLQDPDASAEDRRWAECYDYTGTKEIPGGPHYPETV